MLSRVSQRKTNTVYDHLHVESKKYSKLVNKIKKKQTHRYREKNYWLPLWRGKGGGAIEK